MQAGQRDVRDELASLRSRPIRCIMRSSSACNSISGLLGAMVATTARGLRPPKLVSPCTFTSNGLRSTRNSKEAISLAEAPSISPMKRKVT